MIRSAVASDLPVLREVERAAGEIFRHIGMAEIADDEPLSLTELIRYQEDGRAWVATDEGGRAVAYLLVREVDGCAHIEQVSVHPDHAHRRLGRVLIDVAGQWADKRGLTALTLTTFLDVPWNAPYYERLGFVILPGPELGPGLRQVCEEETALGRDAWPRVAMRRPVSAPDPG